MDPPVDDLDAINVIGEAVWTCYYSDYPIVRMEHDTVTLWSTHLPELSTVDHLLVDHDRVALIVDHVVIGRLDDETFTPTATTSLDLPTATKTAARTHVIARGAVLYVVAPDGHWSITDLETLEAAAY